jgi:hypothetical protein
MPAPFFSVLWEQIKASRQETNHSFCYFQKGSGPYTYDVFYVDSLAALYLKSAVTAPSDVLDFENNFQGGSIPVDGPEGAVVVTYKQVAAAVLAVDYDARKNPLYVGRASPGASRAAAVWQIRKNIFDPQGSLTDIQYANGSMAFDAVWNDRASLSYS